MEQIRERIHPRRHFRVEKTACAFYRSTVIARLGLFALVAATTVHVTDAAFAANAQALETFKRQAVSKMCAGGGDWLRCFSIDPLQCESISSRLLDDCVNSEAALRPGATDGGQDASVIAQSLFTCLRTKFIASHGAKKVGSDECAEVDS